MESNRKIVAACEAFERFKAEAEAVMKAEFEKIQETEKKGETP
jgi:hypothetical protein